MLLAFDGVLLNVEVFGIGAGCLCDFFLQLVLACKLQMGKFVEVFHSMHNPLHIFIVLLLNLIEVFVLPQIAALIALQQLKFTGEASMLLDSSGSSVIVPCRPRKVQIFVFDHVVAFSDI